MNGGRSKGVYVGARTEGPIAAWIALRAERFFGQVG